MNPGSAWGRNHPLIVRAEAVRSSLVDDLAAMSESDSEVLHALIARVALGDQAGLRSPTTQDVGASVRAILRISKRRDLAEELLQETLCEPLGTTRLVMILPPGAADDLAHQYRSQQGAGPGAQRHRPAGDRNCPGTRKGWSGTSPTKAPDPLSLLAAGDALAVTGSASRRPGFPPASELGPWPTTTASTAKSPSAGVSAGHRQGLIRRGLESQRCLDRRE